MLKEAAITESTFVLLPGKEALIKCSIIIKHGNEYLTKAADYRKTEEELNILAAELAELEKIQPMIGMIINDRRSARRSIKDLLSEAHFILHKLDNAFVGIVDDDDFINGWFAVRKTKGRRKPKEKSVKEQAVNN